MIPELGPTPGQYTSRPHLYGVHRRLYEMLGERVAEHLATPMLPRERQQQLGDAFQRVRQSQADEANQHRPDAIARLFGGVYRKLVAAGLLPGRDEGAMNDSMAAHSRDVAVAMNSFNLQSQRYWSALGDKLREIMLAGGDDLAERLEASEDPQSLLSESRIAPPEIPEGLLLIGRHPLSTTQSYQLDKLSRFHLAAQYVGNYVVMRDGFYPPSLDEGQLVGSTTWKASTNGSSYFDDENRRHPIPADRAIVLPNKPVKIKLGPYYLGMDTRGIRSLPRDVVEQLRQANSDLDRDITNERFNAAMDTLIAGPTRSLTVGREEGNGFRLDDERASRFHARVTYEGGKFFIADLDTTNGTQIRRGGGDPIPVGGEPVPLQSKDNILIGRTVLVFKPSQLPS